MTIRSMGYHGGDTPFVSGRVPARRTGVSCVRPPTTVCIRRLVEHNLKLCSTNPICALSVFASHASV